MPRIPPTHAFADLFEMAVDCLAERDDTRREALVIFGRGDDGTGRRTYGELESNANRFAHHLLELGVRPGDRIALYLENRPEYVEILLGAYKARATPINVNFRYVESELQYLLADCEARVVVHEPHFADNLAAIRPELPAAEFAIEMGPAYDETLARSSDDRPVVVRSGDDPYILYTGGTTGLPKGVVWRQEDAFYTCLGGGDPMRLMGQISDLSELPDRMVESFKAMLLAPFMHAAGSWVTMMNLIAGSTSLLPRGSLDPELVWETASREAVNILTVIGDSVARPLLDEWDANPGRWDVPSLFSISNGGAPLSATMKGRIASAFPNCVIADGFGSSEAGIQGSSRLSADQISSSGAVAEFQPGDDTTVVLGDDDRPLPPGSPDAGRVARRGRLPIGYLNDPEKTAETFVTIDGERWLVTGDLARIAEDGTIELLGRDKATINTGGEKVHGEEVENALRSHPGVYDVTVVGVPDDRWGSAVCAVVQPTPGHEVTLESLDAHCRDQLAGYKIPRHLVLVDEVVRSPAGKADLRWAAETAAAAVTPSSDR